MSQSSPTEALKALRERLDLLDSQTSQVRSADLLEWRMRCLELDTEFLKVEALIRLSDKGWPVDYSG